MLTVVLPLALAGFSTAKSLLARDDTTFNWTAVSHVQLSECPPTNPWAQKKLSAAAVDEPIMHTVLRKPPVRQADRTNRYHTSSPSLPLTTAKKKPIPQVPLQYSNPSAGEAQIAMAILPSNFSAGDPEYRGPILLNDGPSPLILSFCVLIHFMSRLRWTGWFWCPVYPAVRNVFARHHRARLRPRRF